MAIVNAASDPRKLEDCRAQRFFKSLPALARAMPADLMVLTLSRSQGSSKSREWLLV